MTGGRVSAWVRGRSPAPPPQLLLRIDEMTAGVADDAPAADVLLRAAESAMSELLHGGCLTRDSALGLLAVDALVTYAFEAAADDPDRLDARTAGALARIAALATAYGA